MQFLLAVSHSFCQQCIDTLVVTNFRWRLCVAIQYLLQSGFTIIIRHETKLQILSRMRFCVLLISLDNQWEFHCNPRKEYSQVYTYVFRIQYMRISPANSYLVSFRNILPPLSLKLPPRRLTKCERKYVSRRLSLTQRRACCFRCRYACVK